MLGLVVIAGVYALPERRRRPGACAARVDGLRGHPRAGPCSATGQLAFLQSRAHEQGYDTQRFGAQHFAIQLAEKHPLGVGPGQFESYSLVSVHETYLRALSEIGVLGSCSWLALLLTTLAYAVRNAVRGIDTYGLGSATLLGTWLVLVFSGFVNRHAPLAASLGCRGADLGRSGPRAVTSRAVGGIELRTLTSLDELAPLQREWDALVRLMPRPSPWLLHGWLAEWWKHYGEGADLRVHVAFRDGRLVGALPLFVRRSSACALPTSSGTSVQHPSTSSRRRATTTPCGSSSSGLPQGITTSRTSSGCTARPGSRLRSGAGCGSCAGSNRPCST